MRLYVVDAFTSTPFSGNGAGVMVCGVPKDPKDPKDRPGAARPSVLAPLADPESQEARTVMQQVAAEVNLSETAFTWKLARSSYAIRYFTPTVEIALCGHATLATAKVLWETEMVPCDEPIVFRTGEGQNLRCDLDRGRVKMVFPCDKLEELECEEKRQLMEALSLTESDIRDIYKGRLNSDHLVVVSGDAFYRLDQQLNMALIQEVNEKMGVRGLIVTTRATASDGEADIKSRFFCPNAGIPEDPVTGSSFPTLAAYYVPVLNKRSFVGLQDHPRRKGNVCSTALPN